MEDVVMKSRAYFTFVMFIAATFTIATAGVANAALKTVCSSGCNYTTISSALAAAISGDTVEVQDNRVYNESIYMKSGVDVVAGAGFTPTINGSPAVTFFGPASGSLSNCTLDGFKISGGGTTFLDGQIRLEGGSTSHPGSVTNVTISNCTLNRGTYEKAGIYLWGAVAPTISNCVFNECGTSCITTGGLGLVKNAGDGNYITIEGCTIRDAQAAYVGLGGAGIMIQGWAEGSGTPADWEKLFIKIGGDGNKANKIYNHIMAGIMIRNLQTGSDVIIDNNEIYNNGPGKGGYEKAGIHLNDVPSATITRNNVYDNRRAGVSIENPEMAGSMTIANNDLHDNGRAGLSVADLLSGSEVTIGAELAASDPLSYGNDIHGNTMGGVEIGGLLNEGGTGALTADVVIRGNYIHTNYRGGIAMTAAVKGSVKIVQNNIAQNVYGGVDIQAAPADGDCTLVIEKNEIHEQIQLGGIHTGRWDGAFTNPGKFNSDSIIKQNKVHHNGYDEYGGGIDVRHFKGTVKNNLAYKNARGGIRFGDDVSAIINNTVVGNLKGGIVFDDYATGEFNDPPDGTPSGPLLIRNNIAAYNQTAGIRACFDNASGERDYNLLYANFGCGSYCERSCQTKQYGRISEYDFVSCYIFSGYTRAPNDLCGDYDPLFVSMVDDDYHLQAGSPAIDAGDPDPAYNDPLGSRNDMGAYGGPDAIDDTDFPPDYIHCLIDGDVTTGNNPMSGTYIMFDLGGSYAVTDVRLYGTDAYSARFWRPYVGTDITGCTGDWGSYGSQWSVGGGTAPDWYPHALSPSPLTGTHIKLLSGGTVMRNEVFEFNYSTDNGQTWQTPVSTVRDCTSIYGLCQP